MEGIETSHAGIGTVTGTAVGLVGARQAHSIVNVVDVVTHAGQATVDSIASKTEWLLGAVLTNGGRLKVEVEPSNAAGACGGIETSLAIGNS